MKVGLEKLESHEGVAVKGLLDSRVTGLFIDTTFAKEKGFKMKRIKNPLLVKNVDGTVNVGGAIMHQVECNMFFKGHVERVRMDVCNLGKTEVILGMLWLAVRGPLTRHSGATQKPIQYYYVILGLTPIIPRALRCHPAHFPCLDPGYQCRDAKTL